MRVEPGLLANWGARGSVDVGERPERLCPVWRADLSRWESRRSTNQRRLKALRPEAALCSGGLFSRYPAKTMASMSMAEGVGGLEVIEALLLAARRPAQ